MVSATESVTAALSRKLCLICKRELKPAPISLAFATSSYLIIKTVSFIAVVYQSKMRHLVTAEEELVI
jgi:hypothetical protein